MGSDARVRYTKMIIKVNFIELLGKKPINKITVKEICDLAEINRATFYKYYMDAYDLMDKIEEEILEELQSIMQPSIHEGISKTVVRMLEKIKENEDLYTALFSGNGDTGFAMRIFRMCYGEFAAYIKQQFPKLSEAQQAWIYIYTAQGSSGILQYWISDGMREAPQDVADFIEQLISNTLENLGNDNAGLTQL